MLSKSNLIFALKTPLPVLYCAKNFNKKMESVDKLVEIIKKLRAPDGCPWDRKQTHESVRGHLVEECAELLDAIDKKDYPNMREELGDILMHILLHCEIAEEQKLFNFNDVASELAEKLVRRHPHVFGSEHAENENDVLKIWDKVKKEEKPLRKQSPFDKIKPDISAIRMAREVAKNLPELSATPETASQIAGKKIYDAVLEAVKNSAEPEGALRDYISLLRNNAPKQ